MRPSEKLIKAPNHGGHVPPEAIDERCAHAAAAAIVAAYLDEAADDERLERERQLYGITFPELAAAYLCRLRDVKTAKPATLRDHGYVLAEPGTQTREGAASRSCDEGHWQHASTEDHDS